MFTSIRGAFYHFFSESLYIFGGILLPSTSWIKVLALLKKKVFFLLEIPLLAKEYDLEDLSQVYLCNFVQTDRDMWKRCTLQRIGKNVKSSYIDLVPDFIIFQCGINDLLYGHSPKKILKDQHELEAKIEAKFPNSIIYFLPIHPLILNEELTDDLPNISSALVNIWNGFEKSFLEKDGIHLNANGHTFSFPKLINWVG